MDAWVYVAGAVLALGGPLFGYLIKVRQTAGRIGASDASQLWAEGAALRKECIERVKILEEQLRWERENVNKLIAENNRLLREAAGDAR